MAFISIPPQSEHYYTCASRITSAPGLFDNTSDSTGLFPSVRIAGSYKFFLNQ
jgi:hypothetical protein